MRRVLRCLINLFLAPVKSLRGLLLQMWDGNEVVMLEPSQVSGEVGGIDLLVVFDIGSIF
jgi:hypothetical protein